MDIKDAEYQEWYNDLPQEREWFNEPQTDHWSKEPLDNTKVLCEYWSLKNDPDVKVIGTELQTYNLFSKMLKEEGWQINLDYQDELLPEYLEAYQENNKKPIIINLK
jgi:hypothetical protein